VGAALAKIPGHSASARAAAKFASVTRMAQRPLNPEGGEAEKVYARCPRGTNDRVDRLAALMGLSRSDYVRRALDLTMEADEQSTREVAAQAS